MVAAGALAALLPRCSAPAPTPAVGEAIVLVDTDMAVPAFVSRLRIDVYAPDASVWYGSHDVLRSSPKDWPATFGLYAPDATSAYSALVRLRTYVDGNVRDYRGERYAAPPAADAPPLQVPALPVGNGQPRLLDADGNDITPTTEPEPRLAIDRLVLVSVPPGARGAVRVTMHGACVGTMADLASQITCVDSQGDSVAAMAAPLDPDMTVPSASAQGSFDPAAPCTAMPRPPGQGPNGTPLYDEEVCVPGELYVMGSVDGTATLPDLPPLVAFAPPIRIDKYEVTVARFRAALAAGFVSPDLTPLPNNGPLPTTAPPDGDTDDSLCTWSASPVGREDYPVNCVSVTTAREFCEWLGEALPTEAQWEYVAALAGRGFRTRYPWGGDDSLEPPCSRAVYSRGSIALLNNACTCSKEQTTNCGYGPAPVTADSGPDGDVTALGVQGLGGSLSEFVLDAAVPLDANCWLSAPIGAPSCIVQVPTPLAYRGGSWQQTPLSLPVGYRGEHDPDEFSNAIGFRCVRSGVGT